MDHHRRDRKRDHAPASSTSPRSSRRGLALRSAPPVAVDDNAYDMDGDDFYDCEIMSIRCAA